MSATGNYVISGAGNVATLATDAGGNVIGLNNPSSGGVIPLSTVVNQFYHFHGFAGNQLAGDPKFFDFAAGLS